MASYVPSTDQLVIEVFVRDAVRARDFYTALGFELVEDRGTFIAMTWEGHKLFLDERPDMPPPPDFPQANIRIMVPNVDDYWRLAQELGARVVAPIEDRNYGLRDFTIADPDGFGLRFGTRLATEGHGN